MKYLMKNGEEVFGYVRIGNKVEKELVEKNLYHI